MSLAIRIETFEVVTNGKTGTLGRCAGLVRHVVLTTWRSLHCSLPPRCIERGKRVYSA